MTHSINSDSLSDSSDRTHDPIFDWLGANGNDSGDRAASQNTVAALGYSAPEVPLNPQLKQNLFQSLGLPSPTDDLYGLLNLSIQALKSKAETLPWAPIDLAPGFESAICQKDEANRMVACFIRADSSALFPNHTHASEEVIVVLGGDIVEETQTYTVGDRIIAAAGSSHQLGTTQGCLLLCITSMDNQFEV